MSETYNIPASVRPIPQRRIVEKLEEYMDRRDYDAVGRHLRYWLEEARMGRDRRGELMLRNELVGHSRKIGDREGALANAEAALALVEALGLEGTLTEGTTCVNAATAMNAFGEDDRALALFRRAKAIYEGGAGAEPGLLGGLYNNMALTCAALGRWDEAEDLYDRAMALMGTLPNGALEQAVTCLNRANLVEARDGMEAGERAIYDLLEQGAALLASPGLPHDGYYAFTCEKCAPTFEYYGWFAEAEALAAEAKRIYEGA